jgi:hypothetical protein
MTYDTFNVSDSLRYHNRKPNNPKRNTFNPSGLAEMPLMGSVIVMISLIKYKKAVIIKK